MKGILGRKIGMTEVFTTDGQAIPVTVIEVEPNIVTQVKTTDHDGYEALQLALGEQKPQRVNKPLTGHYKAASTTPKRFLKEIRAMNGYKLGDQVTVDIFARGDKVDVTGISKGKGFTGAIKRHNFSRGPMAHGSGYHRQAGSMGSIINRIFKNKKMAGQSGHQQVTTSNLLVVHVDKDKHALLIKGSIPGPKKGLVIVKTTKRTNLKPVQVPELLLDQQATKPQAAAPVNQGE